MRLPLAKACGLERGQSGRPASPKGRIGRIVVHQSGDQYRGRGFHFVRLFLIRAGRP